MVIIEELILRDYQKEDIDFMVNKKRCLNCNEMGLGKTLETIKALEKLNSRSIIVFCPKGARGVWQDEFEKWNGWVSTVYEGKPKDRKKLFKKWLKTPTKKQPRILITNFYYIDEIQKMRKTHDSIVVDEIHTAGLLNRKTKAFEALKKYNSRILFLLTGTPLRQGIQDLYAPLNLVDTGNFNGYWRFCNKYSYIWDNRYGKEVDGSPKNPKQFFKMLRGYMIRHKKVDVLDDLPDKQRQIIKVKMGQKQQKVYDDMIINMFHNNEDTGDFLISSTALTTILTLRQLLDTPYNLGMDTPGSALEASAELIQQAFDNGNSVTMTTTFKSGFDKIEEYILKTTDAEKVFIIQGGKNINSKEVADKFNEYPSKNKVLLFTIASGMSFTATSANITIFLGADYALDKNLQAEDRIYRIGQEKKVMIYYVLYPEAEVHQRLVEILQNKQSNFNYTIDTKEAYRIIKERHEKFDKKS